jgi:glycosyltransferase involved in cell wall biosynthesis
MIVAHVLSSFELGGQERVALELAAAQRRSGNRVLAISLASGSEGTLAAAFRAADVETLSVCKRRRLDPTLPFRLARLLGERHVEIVHTHNPFALVYGAPAGRLAGCAVLHTKHGVNPGSARRRALRRLAAALTDAYVAVTPTLGEVARQRRECASSRLFVVANGIDTARFAPNDLTRASMRSKLGVSESTRVVGTVGRLATEKNQLLLLAALEPLLDDSVLLVVVGDGPLQSALCDRVERSRRQARIRLLGARSDVAELLTAFDLFVLSSNSEGLPLVLLEAMATALPVVSTRVGGIADLVEERESGLLVRAGDAPGLRAAVESVLREPSRAAEMGRRGRERVLAQHSLEHMASEYAALYQTIRSTRRLGRARILAGAASG